LKPYVATASRPVPRYSFIWSRRKPAWAVNHGLLFRKSSHFRSLNGLSMAATVGTSGQG
jgi:hypothetical protein